jgi:hypothetical protein
MRPGNRRKGRIVSGDASRSSGRGVSGRHKRIEKVVIHHLAVGEIAVADRSAVLEMGMHGSAVMVLYDRRQRLAAAAHFALPADDGAAEFQSELLPLWLLGQLIRRGCGPEELELYAVGPGLPAMLGVDTGLELLPRLPAPVALDCEVNSLKESRRVEFDVAMGRIVVEKDDWI